MTSAGVKELGSERSKLSKELSKLVKESMTLIDRLADPSLNKFSAIQKRLVKLKSEQQKLTSKLTDLTLQIFDRRDLNISTEDVQAAYRNFVALEDELK